MAAAAAVVECGMSQDLECGGSVAGEVTRAPRPAGRPPAAGEHLRHLVPLLAAQLASAAAGEAFTAYPVIPAIKDVVGSCWWLWCPGRPAPAEDTM